MSTLSAAIQQYGTQMTDAEFVSYLDENTPGPLNSTRYSYQGLVELASIGPIKASVILGLMRAAFDHPQLGELIRAEYAALTLPSADGKVGGLDFSNAVRRQSITQLQSELTALGQTTEAAILQDLLDVGQSTIKRYRRVGLGELPTEAEVTASRPTAIANINWQSALGTINAMLADETTWDDIQTVIAGIG